MLLSVQEAAFIPGPYCTLLHDTQILMFKLVEWDWLCNMESLILWFNLNSG